MLTERERQIVGDVLSPFADRIKRAAVFGSRALGTARPASDIDLVLYGDLSEADVARLWTLFDESSLAVSVDVVDYARLGQQPLTRHIDAVAQTLFTREELHTLAEVRPSAFRHVA